MAPVADSVFKLVSDFINSLPTSQAQLGKDLAAKRSQLKLIVDTVAEQICANVLKTTARNSVEVRQKVAAALKSGGILPEHLRMLQALSDLLKDYKHLQADPYIDHSRLLLHILDLLKNLCVALVGHPALSQGLWAKHLAKLL